MTTKAEKRIRQDCVLDSILTGRFDKYQLAGKFHVIERTIRRDLNEIADNLGPMDKRIIILRKKALDTLGPRINKMTDANLLKLLSLGMTQKVETKTEIKEEVTKEYTLNINEMPEDERNLLKHAIRVYLKGRSETRPSSIR